MMSARSSNVCDGCDLERTPNLEWLLGYSTLMKLDGNLYHPDCLPCKACKQTHHFFLSIGGYHSGCSPLIAKSSTLTYLCHSCRTPIQGEIGTWPWDGQAGNFFHPDCVPALRPRPCVKCGNHLVTYTMRMRRDHRHDRDLCIQCSAPHPHACWGCHESLPTKLPTPQFCEKCKKMGCDVKYEQLRIKKAKELIQKSKRRRRY
jgi:hypothetical protein